MLPTPTEQLVQAMLERRPNDYQAYDLPPGTMSLLLKNIELTASVTLDTLLDAVVVALYQRGWSANYRLNQPGGAQPTRVTFKLKQLGR